MWPGDHAPFSQQSKGAPKLAVFGAERRGAYQEEEMLSLSFEELQGGNSLFRMACAEVRDVMWLGPMGSFCVV